MAFLTQDDIATLHKDHHTKRVNKFAFDFKHEIKTELEKLAYSLYANKPYIMDDLNRFNYGIKTTFAKVQYAYSFDFSKVGGCNKIHPEFQKSYNALAEEFFPSSFVSHQPRYKIWKSDGFLKALAERLHLPKNAYFIVVPIVVDDHNRVFNDDNIIEYRNELHLVYRFA